jgi:hypothetical protein
VAAAPVAAAPVAAAQVAAAQVAAAQVAAAQTTALSSLSSCSRLADVEQFNRAVLSELHRRGVETAGRVVAVSDGAEWIQGVIDLHCPQAVRILDCAHAAQRIALLGQTVAPDDPGWLAPQLHRLKQAGPTPLLAELREQVEQLAALRAQPPPPEVSEALAYLDKRLALLQYPTFQAAGWPIGSGTVESANKLVVEARMKGAGMHWARPNVNALLVLRNAVCNDRWDEAWAHSTVVTAPPPPPDPVSPPSSPPPAPPRPPAPHPWRRYGVPLSPKV